jgi:phage-related protein
MKFPAIAAGISMAAGAAAQLAAGLAAVAAAAAPAVGILGAIPGLVAAAAQGIGTIKLGFGGLSEAVKASGAAEKSAASTSTVSSAQRAAAAQRVAAAQDQVRQASASLANTEATVAREIQQAQQGVTRAREEAAQNVKKAVQGVADAERSAARDIESAQQTLAEAHTQAARDIESAEQRVAAAQRDATQAQLDLIQARADATRQLQDMNNNLVDTGFSVEEAKIGVQRADINRNKVNSNPKSTALDKQQADLDYREAVQRLKEQQLQQQRLAADTAKANRAGVEGSKQVVQARQRVQDANQKLLSRRSRTSATPGSTPPARCSRPRRGSSGRADRRRPQGAAGRGCGHAGARPRAPRRSPTPREPRQRPAHRRLLRRRAPSMRCLTAQRALTEAQAAGTAGRQASRREHRARGGHGRTVARRAPLRDVPDRHPHPGLGAVKRAVQDALLPPVQRGLTALLPLLGILQTGMVRTATIVGGAFDDLARHYLATPLFKRDLATIMASNNRAFGTLATALIPIVRALTDITVASGPLLQRFAQFIATSAIMASNFIHVQRETGGLARFFQLAGDTAGQLWRIARDLVVSIFNIGKAAYPAGKTLLNSFEGVVAKWRAWTGSMKGQNSLRDYFDNAVPMVKELGRLVHDVVLDFLDLGKDNSLAGLIAQIRTQALPAIKRLADNLKGAFGHELVQAISDVIGLLADLTEGGGGGALTTFVGTLDAIVNDLDTLIKMPGVGPIIGFLASLWGGIAAVSLILGPAVKGLKAMSVVLEGLAIRAGLAAEGFTILGVAMDIAMGPVGLILLGLTALGIGFYELYQHSETFRNAMNALGREIKREWGILVDDLKAVGNFLAPAARAIGGFVGQVIDNIKTAFQKAPDALRTLGSAIMNGLVFGMGDAVRGVGSWLNDHVLQPIVNAVKGFFGIKSPSRVMMALGGDIIAGLIQGLLSGNPVAVISRIATQIGGFFANLGRSIRDWWNREAAPIWVKVRNGWNNTRDAIGRGATSIKNFFTGLGNSIKDWWNRNVSPTWAKVRNGWNSTRDNISNNVNRIKGFFADLGNRIRDWWNRTVAPTWANLRNAWNNTRTNISNNVNRMKGFFSNLGSAILGVWRGSISVAFNAVKTGLSKVADAFRTGVSRIKTFWTGLQNAVKGPVRFVIDTIYNNGIRGFWNAVASKVSLPTLGKLTVKGINASRGTVVPGYAPGVDIVNAKLSPGEGVLVPEAVRGLAKTFGTSAENAIQFLNAQFSSRVARPMGSPTRRSAAGLPRFDLGGIFGGIGSGAAWLGGQIGTGAKAAASFAADKIGSAAKALANAVRGMLSGPLHAAASPLHSLINRVLPTSPWFSNVMRHGGNKLIDDVIDKIVGRDQKLNAPAVADPGIGQKPVFALGSGVTRWTSIVLQALKMNGLNTGLLNKVLSQMRTESGGNPNIIQGIHDVNSGGNEARGLMQVIPPTFKAFHFPGTSWNIFDPLANVAAALRYAKSRYGPSLYFLGQGHGYGLGGLVSSVLGKAGKLFDTGGILRPGATLAANATGQNEYVLTGPQWDSIYRLASNAASGAAIHEPTAAERLRARRSRSTCTAEPGQDPREIAREVAVEMGWLLR